VNGNIAIPCVVAARPLWRTQYAPALIRVAPNRQKLVWAERRDLEIQSQSATADELSATLRARVLREEPDSFVVCLRTRGIPTEIVVLKAVMKGINQLA
jgi:hypothetical protein